MNIFSVKGLALAAGLVLAGCSSYRAPAPAVDIPSIAEGDINNLLKIEPATQFPAKLAVAHIQAADRAAAPSNSGYGSGRYSVVPPSGGGEDAELARLAALPQIAAVQGFNRMLLPPTLNSIRDLRVIAAKLQADLLLIYTTDIGVRSNSESGGPLATATFGLLKDKTTEMTATTSGILVDVRTGFMYGLIDSKGDAAQTRTVFHVSNRKESQALQARSEQKSLGQFVGEFERLWGGVLRRREAGEIF